jgi:hypothetical protein
MLIVLRMCVYILYFYVQTVHNARAHMCLCRIAIWNRNRVAMAVAICAWSTNLAFFVHSKSPPSPAHIICSKGRESYVRVICIDIALVSIPIHPPRISGFRIYHCLQIHATWSPTQSVCDVLNTETTTKTMIALLFRMSSYASQCLLACFACAFTAPCTAWRNSSGAR